MIRSSIFSRPGEKRGEGRRGIVCSLTVMLEGEGKSMERADRTACK